MLYQIVLFYIMLVIAFYFISNSVMFQPPPSTYRDNANILKISLKNGKKISAIYLPNQDAKYTILLSHGNAEDLGQLFPLLQLFHRKGYSIISYDYEGYGTSEGKSSEKNSYEEIKAVYQYLIEKQKLNPNQIILYGRSVGSGPSIYLASLFPVKALILESPFVSAYRTITIFPLIPFDKYPNLARIQKMTIPLLVIHGKNDNVIEPWHSKKILAAAKGYKEAYFVENSNHNDLLFIAGENYWRVINRFIENLDKK